MIQPRLVACVECTTIPTLLGEIDCKIVEIAKKMYNNITLLLGHIINADVMIDLLNYKRILTYRYYNEDYAPDYTLEQIISKVKLLKYK